VNPTWPTGECGYLMVFDPDQKIYMSVMDWDRLSADDFLGWTEPITVRDALQHRPSVGLPVLTQNPSKPPKKSAQGQAVSQGEVFVEFQLFDMQVGQIQDEKVCLRVKIDELFFPPTVCKLFNNLEAAKVQVKVTPGTKKIPKEWQLPASGVVRTTGLGGPVPTNAASAVSAVLSGVIKRLSTEGMSVPEIAEVTELQQSEVTAVLSEQKLGEIDKHSVMIIDIETVFHIVLPAPLTTPDAGGSCEITILTAKDKKVSSITVPLVELRGALKMTKGGKFEFATTSGVVSADMQLQILGTTQAKQL